MTDRFTLLEQLGRGGMGVVWKTRDNQTGDVIALKLLHSIYADDRDYVVRLEREVEVVRRIDSKNVVRVLGYGRRDEVPYIAMEYVAGRSLREEIKARGPLPWHEVQEVAADIAIALRGAHEAKVIHRDVKPSNILLGPDGARLADFGIARASDLTRLTGSSTMLGTPHYMAPEGDATPAGDWYALGCVIYEALTGDPPFTGDSMQQVLLKHIRDAPDLSCIPLQARELVDALLQKEPGERIVRAEALVARLVSDQRFRQVVVAGPSQLEMLWSSRGSNPVRALALSSIETLVAAGFEDGSLRVWRWTDDAEVLRTLPGMPPVRAIEFFPHGTRLLSLDARGDMTVHDMRQRPGWSISGSRAILAGVDAQERRLVTISAAHVTALWRVNGEHHQLRHYTSGYGTSLGVVPDVRPAFSPDGECVAIAETPGTIALLSTMELRVERPVAASVSGPISHITFRSPRMIRWIAGRHVWEWDSGLRSSTTHLVTILPETGVPSAFAHSGNTYAHYNSPRIAVTRIRDPQARPHVSVIVADPQLPPCCLSLSADGSHLAAGSADGNVLVYRVPEGPGLKRLADASGSR